MSRDIGDEIKIYRRNHFSDMRTKTEKGSSSTLNFIKVNTLKKWVSFYRTSGASTSQVEFFFRESRNQIALKTYR